MAEAGSNGEGSGGDEARPRSEIEAPRLQIDDQPIVGASSGSSAEASSVGGGNGGHAMEVGGDGERRTPVPQGRTSVGVVTGSPRVQRLDFQSGVEGLMVTSSGLGGAGGSSNGGGSGDDQSGLPPRGSTSGKDPMVVEDVPRERPVERVEFIPPAGSSRHDPITSSDLAEFVGEEALARLMVESPAAVAAVMVAREERLQ